LTDLADTDDLQDDQVDPSIEPKSARAWLAQIKAAEDAFDDYQNRADNIDRLYSDLIRLAANERDRQFQLFWANVQVLGPSIYARPPVPVVVPKFKDRRPLYRTASEILERSTVVGFDLTDIDGVMKLLRDDLTIQARGVAWVRYETDDGVESVCIEHKDRKDFLHEPARKWAEVGWVAAAAYLSKRKMKKRFSKKSGKAYQDATYTVQKDDKENGAADNRAKAKVWEIWSKDENKVVWVTEGCDALLDEGEPHLKLEGFFPCPKPAYGTLQRRSLVPVPDIVYYRDQLEEVNQLTARIHALADALKVRGFYPAGASDIGDAVEAAVKSNDDRRVLIPVSNWAAFGSTGGDPIIWLPIDQIAQVVTSLVELRKQLINDVYEIVGLSDIMRGSTEASETATAQQLKSQYGSVRIRDKQAELVRIARDLARIAAEIMAENFSKKTLLDMSQLQIPSNEEIAKQIEGIQKQAVQQFQQQLQQAKSNPQLMQQAQSNPEQAQQVIQQAQQQIQQQAQAQIEKVKETVTIEQVMDLLHDQKLRPFVLDIETDSTIQPDEDAEKQRRTEFVAAIGQFMQEFGPVIQAQPKAAPFVAELLKFAAAPYRAGRDLENAIEEFAEQISQTANQQQQPSPEAEAAKAQAEATQAQAQAKQQESQAKIAQMAAETQHATELHQANMQVKAVEVQGKQAEAQARLEQIANDDHRAAIKHQQDIEKGALEIQKRRHDIEHAQLQSAALVESAAIKRDQAEHSTEIKEREADARAKAKTKEPVL
jgi:hypothetical protein